MQCQLARIHYKGTDLLGWKGRLLWVEEKPPHLGTVTVSLPEKKILPNHLSFHTPYLNSQYGLPQNFDAKFLELLPFFLKIEEGSLIWEEWEAKGGEPMPEEEAA
jgi:hypothetical protein